MLADWYNMVAKDKTIEICSPNIGGYAMPHPRTGTNAANPDFELNAMFKAVLHRPSRTNSHTESMLQDDR